MTVLFVALLPGTPASALGGPTGGFALPAGVTVTFTNAAFQGCNSLSWGYQLGSGSDQIMASKPAGCLSQPEPDVTIGPFAADTILRAVLIDNTCNVKYYSDGTPVDHVIVAGTAPNFTMRFADAGGFCERAIQTTNTFQGFNFAVDLSMRGSPHAVPGGPYTTTRATPITLDASGSTDDVPGVTLDSYKWSWTPGPSCGSNPVLSSDNETLTVPQLTVTPLCDLNLTLTVTDSTGQTDTAHTLLTINARTDGFQSTPVTYSDHFSSDPRTPNADPTIENLSSDQGLIQGVNVVATPCLAPGGYDPVAFAGPEDPAIFCPYEPMNQSHKDNGYKVATVTDQNGSQRGPFDGDAYVANTSLNISMWGLFNPKIYPEGEPPNGAIDDFYELNSQRKRPIDSYLSALSQHEGMGTATNPYAGHTGAMAQAVKTNGGNIVHQIEPLFGTSTDELTKAVDSKIEAAERFVNACARDPLPNIFSDKLFYWDGAFAHWTKELTDVGDGTPPPMTACRP